MPAKTGISFPEIIPSILRPAEMLIEFVAQRNVELESNAGGNWNFIEKRSGKCAGKCGKCENVGVAVSAGK